MINVLDKGYVRLVEMMGSDWSPLRSARVSTGGDSPCDDEYMQAKDRKLIQYLLDNGHTSPFESIVLTFEIKAPIFVVRQWHRHRTWSYNELSGRYSELPAEFYVPSSDKIGKQGKLNKQSRDTCANIDEDVLEQLAYFTETSEASNKDYQYLLKEGWPREIARAVLPVNWYTRMYATVNLHNLFHFLKLRDHSHAQYEIREYAKAINRIVAAHLPIIWDAWQKSKQSKYVKGVRQFHEKFKLGYEGPARWIPDMHEFRAKFLQEEVDEYKEAVSKGDMVKAFDALIDIVYVAIGTGHLHGFPMDEGFEAVQEANMLKERATSKEQSKRDSTFDVVKPEGWVSPEAKLEDLLRETNPCLS
jgi:thymidylate synthase (FAD)